MLLPKESPSLLSDPTKDRLPPFPRSSGTDPLRYLALHLALPQGVDLQREENILQLAVDLVGSNTLKVARRLLNAYEEADAREGTPEARATFDRAVCDLRDLARAAFQRTAPVEDQEAVHRSRSLPPEERVLEAIHGLGRRISRLEDRQGEWETKLAGLLPPGVGGQ